MTLTYSKQMLKCKVITSEELKAIADDKCQLCNEPAHFADKEDNPYLEEHHVVQLANSGRDEYI